jgi:cyclase
MKKVRIIPRLDIKGSNLVKGIHLEGLRVLGNPSIFAHYYYNNGADELLLMDVVASLYGLNGLSELISEISKNIFIPITVGGGIRNISDIKNALRSGADKVSINTAAIKDTKFIRDAVNEFGSSTISIAIEAIKKENDEYFAFTDNGRENSGLKAIEWAQEVEQLGVGEIILTSVDNEGTGLGFDLKLLELFDCIDLPLVYHGGIGNIESGVNVCKKFDIQGISIASGFHYKLINDKIINSSLNCPKSISSFSIKELKLNLNENNILTRK